MSPSSPNSQAGFTVVELLIAVTVMMIALMGVVATITSVGTLGAANEDSARAYQAARSMVETLQSESPEDVFARYNDDPADDPGGAGTAPGRHFAVPGLRVQTGDADGFVGQVLVPATAGGALREDVDDQGFGLPRDLNGDGAIDGDDHADDYILLPIRVRMEWTGNSGDRFFEYATMLGVR